MSIYHARSASYGGRIRGNYTLYMYGTVTLIMISFAGVNLDRHVAARHAGLDKKGP